MKIGFIGLGTMGFHMAGHIAAAGFTTAVYNRTSARADAWLIQHQGESFSTIDALAKECDVIISCVGNDDDVRGVYFGDASGEKGVLANAKEGAILIDHTTTSAVMAKEIDEQATAQGCSFLDAPVSGGEIGAINGQLTTMVGGDAEVLEKGLPMLRAYSKAVTHMGAVGNGQLTKMVNQICIAGVLQGLSEALTFAEASGLNIDQVSDAISGGAAGSWQLSNRLKTMHAREFDFGFAIDWMRKDLAFCLDQAKQKNLDLMCVKHVDNEYSKLQAVGESQSDTSVLVKQYD